MRLPTLSKRAILAAVVVLPLIGIFLYTIVRSGPLEPISVTVAVAGDRSVAQTIFGVGIVEARYTYKIGPIAPGRLMSLTVNVGERVKANQLLGEMDSVDLLQRIDAQTAAVKRTEANVASAQAQTKDAGAKKAFSEAQLERYKKLLEKQAVTVEAFELKERESQSAEAIYSALLASLDSARRELERVKADREGLYKQFANLKLVSPVEGLVAQRYLEPGSTAAGGQTVVEIIDPKSLWISVRFAQMKSAGLKANLPVSVVLRSQSGRPIKGRIARIEPVADSVTEEILARVVLESADDMIAPINELAEVTAMLSPEPTRPTVPDASLQNVAGRLGVWVVEDGKLRFAPVRTGAADFNGNVQITEGLSSGEKVVVYSSRGLEADSKISIVEKIHGISR